MDLSNAFLHLVISAGLCGLIGLEREWRNKTAGLLAHGLVGVGSTLLTLISIHGFTGGDPSRLVAQMVTGIGFIGGGAIMRRGNLIRGLATAATLWMTLAIGITVGIGWFALASIVTASSLALLLAVPWITSRLPLPERHRIVLEVFVSLEAAEAVSSALTAQGALVSHGGYDSATRSMRLVAALPATKDELVIALVRTLQDVGASRVTWSSSVGEAFLQEP
jgi:uncharacterized membrane protein YhiD involved in acid resistance